MRDIQVGDIVTIVNDNEYWDGTRAEVVSIHPEQDVYGHVYPYKLKALTETPIGHYKPGDILGRWSERKLKRDLTPVEEAVEKYTEALDVFFSPYTDRAVVLLPSGKFVRILEDGTEDTP